MHENQNKVKSNYPMDCTNCIFMETSEVPRIVYWHEVSGKQMAIQHPNLRLIYQFTERII